MRVADLFRRLHKSFRLSRSLNLILYSALSINRILAASAFRFPGFVQTSILPLLEKATFSPSYSVIDEKNAKLILNTAASTPIAVSVNGK